MSQLNLTPDPVVLGAEAVLFLANLYVVNKFILSPYLAVKTRREDKTKGSQVGAQQLLEQAQALERQITEKMREAHKEASIIRENIKTDTNQKRVLILSSAEALAKKEQLNIANEISKNIAEVRANISGITMALVNEFYGQLTKTQ